MMTKLSMKQKSILFLLTAALCCMVFSGVVFAEDQEENVEEYYELLIIDDADLLTDEEEERLYDAMYDLGSYGNVVFTSVVLADGDDYESFAEQTYYECYGNEPGVLFQVDMGNRKLTLCASTEMEKEIGSERESIVDNVYTYASDGDYYACAAEVFREIYVVLNDGQIAHTMKYIDNGILALIIALILNFIFVFRASGGKLRRSAVMAGCVSAVALSETNLVKGRLEKIFDPVSSDSDGGSGGGSSGGGGGGGGFSGGSSSHGF